MSGSGAVGPGARGSACLGRSLAAAAQHRRRGGPWRKGRKWARTRPPSLPWLTFTDLSPIARLLPGPWTGQRASRRRSERSFVCSSEKRRLRLLARLHKAPDHCTGLLGCPALFFVRMACTACCLKLLASLQAHRITHRARHSLPICLHHTAAPVEQYAMGTALVSTPAAPLPLVTAAERSSAVPSTSYYVPSRRPSRRRRQQQCTWPAPPARATSRLVCAAQADSERLPGGLTAPVARQLRIPVGDREVRGGRRRRRRRGHPCAAPCCSFQAT